MARLVEHKSNRGIKKVLGRLWKCDLYKHFKCGTVQGYLLYVIEIYVWLLIQQLSEIHSHVHRAIRKKNYMKPLTLNFVPSTDETLAAATDCYLLYGKHFMTGFEGNSEFCFPRISMFPETV